MTHKTQSCILSMLPFCISFINQRPETTGVEEKENYSCLLAVSFRRFDSVVIRWRKFFIPVALSLHVRSYVCLEWVVNWTDGCTALFPNGSHICEKKKEIYSTRTNNMPCTNQTKTLILIYLHSIYHNQSYRLICATVDIIITKVKHFE